MRLSDLHRRIIASRPKLDPDAVAFLTAAGITDATITDAINTLVKGLKSNNIWSKMKALYPFVGGTATTHKFNLKDPRDLNAAFRLVFNGGWTHSANGALPNGSSGYAETFLNDNLLTVNNKSLSYYSRTNNTINTFIFEIGVIGSYRSGLSLHRAYFNVANRSVSDIASLTSLGAAIFENSNNTLGLYIANRVSDTDNKLFKNSNQIASNTDNWGVTTAMNLEYYIGVVNANGAPGTSFSPRQCALASIGDGLTDSEALTYYNLVQAFQTTLGRQV
jgi:hypothetical protein